jgi:hypothetical protein
MSRHQPLIEYAAKLIEQGSNPNLVSLQALTVFVTLSQEQGKTLSSAKSVLQSLWTAIEQKS